MVDTEIDVRVLAKPDKHPTIFAGYDALGLGESFILVNDHYPKHLHDEFEIEHPGSFGWERLEDGPQRWRVRISKLAATSLPRVLTNTATIADHDTPDVTGAVWKLQMRTRDLDSNIIELAPDATIETHTGPDLDVLVHVLHGAGRLTTELDTLDLTPGVLLWLPRRSQRRFTAGPFGLRYLTVHQRRPALTIGIGRPTS